jgi:hypothetical protein
VNSVNEGYHKDGTRWAWYPGQTAVVSAVRLSRWIDVTVDGDKRSCGPHNAYCVEHYEVKDVTIAEQGSARNSGPATSKAAAKLPRVSLRLQVLDLLNTYPAGLTGQEIAQRLDKPLNSVTPRFAELIRAKQIVDTGHKRSGQIVWQSKRAHDAAIFGAAARDEYYAWVA